SLYSPRSLHDALPISPWDTPRKFRTPRLLTALLILIASPSLRPLLDVRESSKLLKLPIVFKMLRSLLAKQLSSHAYGMLFLLSRSEEHTSELQSRFAI